jgi:hypothetical protein
MQSIPFSYSQGEMAVTPIKFKRKATFSSLKLSLNSPDPLFNRYE